MNTSELRRRVAATVAELEMLETRRLFAAIPEDVIGKLHQDIWDVAYDAARGRTNELVTEGAAAVDSQGRGGG